MHLSMQPGPHACKHHTSTAYVAWLLQEQRTESSGLRRQRRALGRRLLQRQAVVVIGVRKRIRVHAHCAAHAAKHVRRNGSAQACADLRTCCWIDYYALPKDSAAPGGRCPAPHTRVSFDITCAGELARTWNPLKSQWGVQALVWHPISYPRPGSAPVCGEMTGDSAGEPASGGAPGAAAARNPGADPAAAKPDPAAASVAVSPIGCPISGAAVDAGASTGSSPISPPAAPCSPAAAVAPIEGSTPAISAVRNTWRARLEYSQRLFWFLKTSVRPA